MQNNLLSFLPDHSQTLRIQRSGSASLCRFASDIVAEGRSTVLLAHDAEEFAKYKSLLPLFSRENDEVTQDTSRPQWERIIQVLSPCVQRKDRDTIAQNMAALYALQ